MVKTGIKIFARLRPTKKTTGVSWQGKERDVQQLQLLQVYEVVQSQDGLEALSFTVPRSEAGGAVNNRRETFSFKSVAMCVRVLPVRVSPPQVFSSV